MSIKKILVFWTILLVTAMPVMARLVTGIVLDETDGEPIIGASVLVKGSQVGTSTDVEGRFNLNVPDGAKKLIVSYIGMSPVEVAITSSEMRITMSSAEAAGLDEVVVVAFGEQKKSSFTGSAGVVKSDDIKGLAVNSPVSALQGKVPGVELKNASGDPTSTPTLHIRGTGSINASTTPLYIVDGSPMEGSSYQINPADVESITVLKDAASNALYGARGANGVVMITTKSGKKGKAKVTLSAKLGAVSRAQQDYDVIKDPREFMEMYYRALYNHNVRFQGMSASAAHKAANSTFGLPSNEGGLGYQPFKVPSGETLIGTNGKLNPGAVLGNVVSFEGNEYMILPDDWEKEGFRTGLRQDYNANFSGGSENVNYYGTVGYLNQEGIMKGSDYERYSFRLKGDYTLKSWLNVGANISYNKDRSNGVTTGSSNSLFYIVQKMAPIYPVYIRDGQGNFMYDENGVLYDWGDGKVNGLARPFHSTINYIQADQLETKRSDGNRFTAGGNLNISIPWVKGLKIQIKTDITQLNTSYTSTTQPFYGSGVLSSPQGAVYAYMTKTYSYNNTQLITYVNRFGDHSVNAMIGHEYYNKHYEYISGGKKNMFSYWQNQTLSGAVQVVDSQVAGYNTNYNTEGFLGRFMYDYKDRYFFSVSYRRDASSKFHPDHRWGNFYSFGGAWIMSKEEWFPKTPYVNMLKLKASWGQQGNDGIDDYIYTTTYSINNVDDEIGLNMSVVKGVKNITWETNSNFNAGVEFELLNNRLGGEVEFFTRKTSNMLCKVRVPLDAGYAYQWGNIGDMRNVGVEFSLNYDIIRNRDLVWNVYLNGTHYRNKILKLNDDNKGQDLAGHPGYVSGNYFYGEGLSIHTWRLKRYAGTDPSTGVALWYKEDPETGALSTTSLYSDGSYFHCGTSDPDLYGGFGTSFSWKGIDVSATFAYSIGGKAYDSMYASYMANPSSGSTYSTYHKDIYGAWSETNAGSQIPRFQYAVSTSDTQSVSTSDRFLTDASSLSVQNITIGYTLPSSWMKKLGAQRLRIYFSADNLGYISKRKGFDPRNNFWGSPSTTNYSLTRTLTGGLDFEF